MADPTLPPDSSAFSSPEEMPSPAPQEVGWSQAWQVPVLLLGLGMLAVGLWLSASRSHPAPDFEGHLRSIGQYLMAENLDQARTLIEQMELEADLASPRQLGELSTLRADLAYRQLLRDAPGGRLFSEEAQDILRRIVQDYAQAEENGFSPGFGSLRRQAEALVHLGRETEALNVIDRLEGAPPADRYGLVRTIIERHPGPGAGAAEDLLLLLRRFRRELQAEPDPARRREQEIWLAGHEAKIDLQAGLAERAIDRLLRSKKELQRPGGINSDLVPLTLWLGLAYQQAGDFERAIDHLQQAQQHLPPGDPLAARILTSQGQMALTRSAGGEELARDLFAQVVQEHPSSEAWLDAVIGLAEAEGRRGAWGFSLDHFRQAIEGLLQRTASRDPRREQVQELIRAQIARLVEREDYRRALDFLHLLRPLYRLDLPPDLLEAFAIAHERIGETELLAVADAASRPEAAEARRLANQRAAAAFAESGRYYHRLAQAVTITRDREHGDALWAAARNYDRAQQWDESVRVYVEFVRTRDTDSRQLQARGQLGRAYLAAGEPRAALDQFRYLQQHHPQHLATYAALVPMAQAYLQLGEVDAAQRTLLSVVTDHPAIGPDADHYREALIELGRLYYQEGESKPEAFVAAIERMTEAVERFGDGAREGPMLRFLLADSYRKSVVLLDDTLAERRDDRDRLALQAERHRRLEQAQKYFNQVIDALEGSPADQLGALERLYLRNAFFYRADCAFDRSCYEEAIALYAEAADRYDGTPAALVALVQQVNAYCELGDYRKAAVANRKAHWHLERIPEEAFDNPEDPLPMTRTHWEDWLRWTNELNLYGEQARGR